MQNDGSNPLIAGLFSGENKEICFRGLEIFCNDIYYGSMRQTKIFLSNNHCQSV